MRKLQKAAIVAAMLGSVGLTGAGTAQADGHGDHHQKPGYGDRHQKPGDITFNCYVGEEVNESTPGGGAGATPPTTVPPTLPPGLARLLFGGEGAQAGSQAANVCSPGATAVGNKVADDEEG